MRTAGEQRAPGALTNVREVSMTKVFVARRNLAYRRLAAITLALIAFAQPSHAGVRTETQSYVGAAVLGFPACGLDKPPLQEMPWPPPIRPSLGSACFDFAPSDDAMSIHVEDLSGASMSVYWTIDFQSLSGWFCNDGDIPLTGGSGRVYLTLSPIEDMLVDRTCAEPRLPTTGTVTATISS